MSKERAAKKQDDVERLEQNFDDMTYEQIGYAVDDEEWDEGVRCVGAPIMDYTRKVVGAISISAPSLRMTLEKIKKDHVPLIKDACARISADLGYKALDDGNVE